MTVQAIAALKTRPHLLRLSKVARSMGCVGAFIPAVGYTKSTTDGPRNVINGTGPTVWKGVASTAPTVVMSAEGPVWKTVGGARQESGCSLGFGGNTTTELQFSMVGRFSMAGTPAGDITHLNWTKGGAGGPQGGPTIGFTSGGFSKVQWASDGGGLSGPATGSTNWNGAGPVTIGVSVNSSKNAILYENGINITTGTGGSGSDAANTTPAFTVGFYNGTDSFNGTTYWAFFFNKQLTDAEHEVVALNPGSLLTTAIPSRVGVVSGVAFLAGYPTFVKQSVKRAAYF